MNLIKKICTAVFLTFFIFGFSDVANAESQQIQTGKILKKIPFKVEGLVEYSGHYYKVFDESMNWEQSKNRCEEMGGHLVTITDVDENNFVTKLISNFGKNCYWIGNKLNAENQQVWITGEKMNYSNWAEGEPDNYNGKQGYGLIIAKEFQGTWIFPGKWSDIEIDGNSWDKHSFWGMNNFGFVCEWENYKDIKI